MLHHTLPHRQTGSFGSSPPGQVAEWITTSWLRFEASLVWILLLLLTLATPWPNAFALLGALLMSPLAAVFFLFCLKAAGSLIYLIPVAPFGKTLGWTRLAFIWTFSRLVAEPAPTVEMPLWIGR